MAVEVFPLFLPPAIAAFGGPEGYFSLAIIAFGAFRFIVPEYQYRLGKIKFKESRLLIYHSFQNHYTHKIMIFKLFRSLQLQFSGPTGIHFRYSYSLWV